MMSSKLASTKLSQIQALFTDVDGVMTDGCITLGESGEELRSYYARDGIGLKLCKLAQIKLVIITSSPADGIRIRGERLGFDEVCLHVTNKNTEFDNQANKLGLDHSQIAYIGDDLIDIGPMQKAGIAFTVADADEEVKKHADFVSKFSGGRGAVREICELLVEAKSPQLLSEARSCGLSL